MKKLLTSSIMIASVALTSYADIKTITDGNNVPSGVTRIGPYAFRDCTAASALTLPFTLTTIEDYAFSNCPKLTKIEIPEGVAAIRQEAFSKCDAVKTLWLPSTLLSVGQYAFRNCEGLAELTCMAVRPPEICDGTFLYVNKTTCKLTIPSVSAQAYRDAPYWSEFFTGSRVSEMEAAAAEQAGEWYTLDGIRLPGKPTETGIYLHRTSESTVKIKL